MKDKTAIGMTVLTILIVCGIGYYVGITMIDEIENHPEIEDIGAPPDLRHLVVCVIVVTIVCGIALLTSAKEDEENHP